MNHMEKSKNLHGKALRELSSSVGDFISYWGFRRIHGEIWALVYLSKTPISGAELVQALKVSKALISPALKQLEDYELIFQVKSEDSRAKLYQANPNFMEVIKKVLTSRELPMLAKVQNKISKLNHSEPQKAELNLQRLELLSEMVLQANMALLYLTQLESFGDVLMLSQNIPAAGPQT
jgi:DNA-binding transcriptional regulator GbsR (MarR family)